MAKIARVKADPDQGQNRQTRDQELKDRHQTGKAGQELDRPEINQGKDDHNQINAEQPRGGNRPIGH